MSNELKLNRADFSFRSGRRAAGAAEAAGTVVKSSYELPEAKHRELRVLSARLGRRIGSLLEEAVDDLLAKYGK